MAVDKYTLTMSPIYLGAILEMRTERVYATITDLAYGGWAAIVSAGEPCRGKDTI
jgi:hypothetical protein